MSIRSKLEFKRPGKSKRRFETVSNDMAEEDQDQDFEAGYILIPADRKHTEKHLDKYRISYFHAIHDTHRDPRDERAAPTSAEVLGMRKRSG